VADARSCACGRPASQERATSFGRRLGPGTVEVKGPSSEEEMIVPVIIKIKRAKSDSLAVIRRNLQSASDRLVASDTATCKYQPGLRQRI